MNENKSKLSKALKILRNVIFIILIFFIILIITSSYLTVKSDERSKTIATHTEVKFSPLHRLLFSGDYRAIEQKTPRGLFAKFLFNSILTWSGKTQYFTNVFECINSSKMKLDNELQLENLIKSAEMLFYFLLNIDFNFSQIPLSVIGNTLELTLDEKGQKQTLYLKRGKDGNWRFSEKNFTNPKMIHLWKDHCSKKHGSFERLYGLSSPIKSYLNFIFGFQQEYGFTMENALEVLDLSNVPKVMRESYGRSVTFVLYKVLMCENISFSSISTNPTHAFPQILYTSTKYGSIFLYKVLIDKKTDTYKWIFTKSVIGTALNLYRKELMKPSVYDNIFVIAEHWIFSNIGFLDRTLFNIECAIWLLLIICVYVSYFILLFSKKIIFYIITFSKFLKSASDYVKYAHRFSLCSAMLITLLFILYTVNNTLIFHLNIYIWCFYIIIFVKTVLFIWWLCEVINIFCSIALSIIKRRGSEGFRTNFVVEIIRRLSCILVAVVLTGLFLDELGVNMVNFLTALGIGGVAIAFAGKDTIENLFGSIMLTMEKPFKIGDWIIIDDIQGDVEHVGLRSTRIRTYADSYVTVPNVKFITNSVNNMGARTYRRFKTVLGVEESTPTDILKAFVEGLYTIIKETPNMRKSHYHVRVNDFGESSINILVYVFFLAPDWATELRERETFILNILKLAEQMNIKLAYPTRTLTLAKENKKINKDMDDIKQLNKETAQAKKTAKKIVEKSFGEPPEAPPPFEY
jgi:MscS family membrane protein